MSVLVNFVTVIHIALCFIIVLAVLVQQGKGAEISASFGGSSQTVFGSSGGATFFTRFTGVCAGIFMLTSLFLATAGGSKLLHKSVMDTGAPVTSTAPATTAPVTGAKPANPAAAPAAPNSAPAAKK